MSFLVFGGCGAVGKAVVEALSVKYSVVSVDFSRSELAARSVILQPQAHWGDQLSEVEKALEGSTFQGIYVAAGGWSGGSILSKDLVANVDRMMSFNLHSAVQASRIAAKTLAPGGLLVLTGAAAALEGTAGMIAYGVSKGATHQLTASMAAHFGEKASVLALLPITIDTPSNRAGMPNADFSTWTPPSFIAATIQQWLDGPRPPTGSLLKIVTQQNQSNLEIVH